MAPPGSIVVIGGGFAGLSCAVALAGHGARVTLLEARREPGGRATSFVDGESGDVVDNGQHLFMACYGSTRAFLETIGAADRVRYQRRLRVDYLEPGRRTVLRGAPLPAPWHLVAGLLAMKGLGARDRAALLAAGPALRRLADPATARDLEAVTVSDWLDRLGQTPALRRLLWHPLAIATLNASPRTAPASLLACVLREGFLARASDSGLGVATVGLSELYAEPARRWLEARGARVTTGAPVAQLRVEGDGVRAAVLRDGTELPADAFVCAVPPDAARRLGVPVDGLERFASSPIVSINLWPERPLRSLDAVDFAAMPDGTIHWIFNKGRILGEGAGHLAAVISAADGLGERLNEELARLAWDELGACLPEARAIPLRRWMVVRERTATFSATVETEPLRPGPRTAWRNLLLAGDWTMRGMPATIESAVRSGQGCARMLLHQGTR
ncbi:MAG: hydroxysqualene dehydroxylase HpnE [Candidatus Polarisedimenticolia bacterium]